MNKISEVANGEDTSPDVGSETRPVVQPPGPSNIAARVQSLKSAAMIAAAKRNRLPHTLFWSLLRTEIDVIKKRKAKQRLTRRISQ